MSGNKYTFRSPDLKHEYFVMREERYDTYYITSEKKYKDRKLYNPYGGFFSAEEAQAELERIARRYGWVREAEL